MRNVWQPTALILILMATHSTAGAQPPQPADFITLSDVHPALGGPALYEPLAPTSSGVGPRYRLRFRAKLKNASASTVVLEKIRMTLRGTSLTLIKTSTVNVAFAAGQSKSSTSPSWTT